MRLFTPKTAAAFDFDGQEVLWAPGQLIEEGALILRGRESLVRPVVVDYPAPPRAAAKPQEPAKKPSAEKQQPAEKGSAG